MPVGEQEPSQRVVVSMQSQHRSSSKSSVKISIKDPSHHTSSKATIQDVESIKSSSKESMHEHISDGSSKEIFINKSVDGSGSSHIPPETTSIGSGKEVMSETSHGSEKEVLDEVSQESEKDSIGEFSKGSEKEFEVENSYGSSKELIPVIEAPIEEDSESEDQLDNLEVDLISLASSSKDLKGDSDISAIRSCYNAEHPSRRYIDKRSFNSASAKYVEITSGGESEMDTHKSIASRQTNRINFHEVPEMSVGSSKETEMELTNGSSKELLSEAEEAIISQLSIIMDKSADSSKEYDPTNKSSMKDGDLESKESSKEIRSKVLETAEYISQILEESEEEDKVSSIYPESLSSHVEQISESEREPTPKNSEPWMDSKIRDSVLKINTILKKNPTSLKQLAKNLIHSQPQLPSHPPHQSQKRLFDYGDFAPPSSNHRYGRPARDTLHKSVENLSAQEGEYQDYGSVKPLLPQRQIPRQPIVHQSLETLKPDEETRNRFFVDWATTPIYDEYRDTGTREYNYTRHQAFY